MIIPELYDFITAVGGVNHKGWVLASFTLTAGLSKLYSGKAADQIGRLPVMIIGALVCIIAAFFYPLVTGLFAFIALRMFHGISTGFKPTGTTAYISDLVPDNRRGEAMGIIGFTSSSGMALGPTFGSYVRLTWGFDWMFWLSGLIALASLLVILNMKETLPKKNKKKLTWSFLKINKHDFYEPRALKPAIVFFLYALSFGGVYTLIPDFTNHLGISNKGLFFTLSVGVSTISRIISGKMSDKKGRLPVLMVGLFLNLIGLLLLANTNSLNGFILTSIVYGLSVGINSPVIYAWITDVSLPEFKGRAFSTMFIGMEFGIGLGGLMAANIYQNNSIYFQKAYYLLAFTTFISLVLVWYIKKTYQEKI